MHWSVILSRLDMWPGQRSPKIIPVLYKPAYCSLQGTGGGVQVVKDTEDGGGSSRKFNQTKQNNLVDTHWNRNVTDELRLTIMPWLHQCTGNMLMYTA